LVAQNPTHPIGHNRPVEVAIKFQSKELRPAQTERLVFGEPIHVDTALSRPSAVGRELRNAGKELKLRPMACRLVMAAAE
jgi:hypothetical protein